MDGREAGCMKGRKRSKQDRSFSMPRLCSLWVRLVRKLTGRKVKYLVRVIQVVRDGFDCEQFDSKALTLT